MSALSSLVRTTNYLRNAFQPSTQEEVGRSLFPPISPELVLALRNRFPWLPPKLDAPDRKLWTEVGWQEVINFLESEMRRQRNPSDV